MTERFEKPNRADFFEEMDALSPLWRLPVELIHIGPTYQATAKDGRFLSGQTYVTNIDECIAAGCRDLTEGLKKTDIFYLVVRDVSGKIIGTHISSLFDRARGWPWPVDQVIVRSKIEVFEKGRGYASPVEEMFQRAMQRLANVRQKEVCLEAENENADKLEEYRSSENVDPEVLSALELEQERWQTLYGIGGKFGFDENGQKKFYPKT